MFDVAFPKGNEQEFCEMAKTLGWKGIVFVYQSPSDFPKQKYGIPALCVSPANVASARQKAGLVFVKSSDQDRFALEKAKPDAIFGLGENSQHDYLHQRASGINNVMAALAAKNNVRIALPFSSVLERNGLEQAQLIGRWTQNIALCRKCRAPMLLASFAKDPWQLRAPGDLAAFARVIGMHPLEAGNSFLGL
jgi:RNase P/RNase MRP subunit p30